MLRCGGADQRCDRIRPLAPNSEPISSKYTTVASRQQKTKVSHFSAAFMPPRDSRKGEQDDQPCCQRQSQSDRGVDSSHP
uniref:Uncharacterized protein n=1 Tax=Mycolicibacterium gilvum (strain PYR-GCK) TaxID=350054 RepID=A4T4J7_MYCGI|nr:hypothetical protein Mflv_0917 [Mycolicibacterium gilvum PYR-GCK]